MSHDVFMRRCLERASLGRHRVGINPMVGAALVRDGHIIAEAHHEGFGMAHAERKLLEDFGGEILPTDTLYTNLEPCCHTEKKTPPCADFLRERGVKRLVFGMLDPNPSVRGKGIDRLRSHGVECAGPVLLAECLRLNRGFISLMTKGRPWVTRHEARTADGRHAAPDGSMLKITDAAQDAWIHRFLRARHQAILVGINTVIGDDPKLNVRHGVDAPDPYRIVLDPHGKIPPGARILGRELKERTIVISATARAPSDFQVPMKDGMFVWEALWNVLTTPRDNFFGISSILLEGGPKTWEIFRSAGVVDEEVILIGS